MSGVSRIVSSATHRCPCTSYDLAVASLRPLAVSYVDEPAAQFADGCRLVRRLEDSADVALGDAAIAYSLAELALDMCPS